jgi:hypothetical protein
MGNSPILFYGPGARQAALNQAVSMGKLLRDPIGDEGLKVDQAREVAELLMSAPVGEEIGVLVVGPLDNATSGKSSDALLKSLEEPSPYMQAVLWADDLGGVPPTIRSRCLDRFAPPGAEEESEVEDMTPQTAYLLVQASLTSDYATLVEQITNLTAKDGDKVQEKLNRMVDAIAAILGESQKDPEKRVLWERWRKVALWRNPTAMELLGALVGV